MTVKEFFKVLDEIDAKVCLIGKTKEAAELMQEAKTWPKREYTCLKYIRESGKYDDFEIIGWQRDENEIVVLI